MGGQNHQPCSKKAPESARLSRHLSSATSNIQLANVRLEDLLIDEIELDLRQPQLLHACMRFLKDGSADLQKLSSTARQLHLDLSVSPFLDSRDQESLRNLISGLVSSGTLSGYYSEMVLADRSVGGFLECLTRIANMAENCHERVNSLEHMFVELHKVVEKDGSRVFDQLEFNTPANIKPAFAVLYTDLQTLSGYFLASALISTEYFYHSFKLGGLGSPVASVNLDALHQDLVLGDGIAKHLAV